MNIHVINPTITREWEESTKEDYARAARPDTIIQVHTLDWGAASIESNRDVALAIPDILTKAAQAEQAGAEAIIIDCMSDPGLYATRESVAIPVVGPAQASMHLASILGHRFSILTVLQEYIPMVEELVTRYGLSEKLASVRSINIPVLALSKDVSATAEALINAGEHAICEDRADTLILGCTGMAGLPMRVQSGLAERGLTVPILDPTAVAVNTAESLIALGLSHSRRAFPPPAKKNHRWPWNMPL